MEEILKELGRRIGGLEVHMLIDADQSIGGFIKIVEAKAYDKNFLKSMDFSTNTMIVFDKVYNNYHQFDL